MEESMSDSTSDSLRATGETLKRDLSKKLAEILAYGREIEACCDADRNYRFLESIGDAIRLLHLLREVESWEMTDSDISSSSQSASPNLEVPILSEPVARASGQTFDEIYVAEWQNREANCSKSTDVLTHHLWITKELVQDLITQTCANKYELLELCDEIVTDGFKKGIKSLLKRISSSISSIEAQIEAALMSSHSRGVEYMDTDENLAVEPVAEENLAVEPVAEEHLAVEPVAEEHLAVEPVAEEQLPQLPTEVVEEIFARAPIESLLRFRTTCSVFYYRTFEMNYIYRHIDLSQERFLRLDNVVHIIDPVATSDMSSAMPEYLKPAAFISTFVHCDGLFLFQNPKSSRLTLWNPLLKVVYWIQPMGVLTTHDCYGIGYCPDKRGCYMIVRIYKAEEDECGKEDKVQVFETETKSWRIVNDSTLDWKVASLHPGLSVKGKMYWLAQSKADPVPTFIQSFDFSEHTFTLVCTLPLDYDPLHTNALSVYNHNRLSLIHQGQNTSAMDVWVTNPLAEEAVAWSHVFTVANQNLPWLRPYYDVGYPVHFLDRNNTVFVLCRERTGEKGQDTDDEQDEGIPQMRLYRIGRNGIQERTDIANTIFFEHHMSGYLYTPSLVWLH